MSHVVKKITKRELKAEFPGESTEESFGKWLDAQGSPVLAFAFEGSDIVAVFAQSKVYDKK